MQKFDLKARSDVERFEIAPGPIVSEVLFLLLALRLLQALDDLRDLLRAVLVGDEKRVGREWVLPIFVLAVGLVAMLFTYPYETLTALTLGYLVSIPLSWRNFRDKIEETENAAIAAGSSAATAETEAAGDPQSATGRVFSLRPTDPQK